MRSQLSKCVSGPGDLWQLQVNVSEAQELSFLPATEPPSSKLEDLKDKAGWSQTCSASRGSWHFFTQGLSGTCNIYICIYMCVCIYIYTYIYYIYSIYVYNFHQLSWVVNPVMGLGRQAYGTLQFFLHSDHWKQAMFRGSYYFSGKGFQKARDGPNCCNQDVPIHPKHVIASHIYILLHAFTVVDMLLGRNRPSQSL